jgi:hypothetical protein
MFGIAAHLLFSYIERLEPVALIILFPAQVYQQISRQH